MTNVAPARTALKRKSVKNQEEPIQKGQQAGSLKTIVIVEEKGLAAILLQYADISSLISKKIEIKTKADFKEAINSFDKKNTVVILIHPIKPGTSTRDGQHLATVHDIRSYGFLKVQSCNVVKANCSIMASKIRGYIINRL